MSKLRNVVVAFLALSLFTVIPAFPQGNAGCKNGKFIGSYTHLDTFPDIWGDAGRKNHPPHADGSMATVATRQGGETCSTQREQNLLDSDRPSHGRR